LEAGPYRTVDLADGELAPFYMMPFDKDGRSEAPLTRAHLLDALKGGSFTDVFIFSHGWNNDWSDASSLYEHFLSGFRELRKSRNLTYPRPFRPLLIGIIWPSTALVLPWEQGPQFAAAPANGAARTDAEVAQERREIQALAEQVAPESRDRFYELTQRASDLTQEEA